jgi:hypothetical protein
MKILYSIFSPFPIDKAPVFFKSNQVVLVVFHRDFDGTFSYRILEMRIRVRIVKVLYEESPAPIVYLGNFVRYYHGQYTYPFSDDLSETWPPYSYQTRTSLFTQGIHS